MAAPGQAIGYRSLPNLSDLIFKNLLLTIVTIGTYRFWARVKLRRYFWSNIVIDGEPLEYVGTGRELFIGFLIVIAILAPIGIIHGIALRAAMGSPVVQGILQLAYLAAILALIQTAVFRSRRYRLSRTHWRGIRAGQTGSTWYYIGLSAVNLLATVVTLGFYGPWADLALERYKVNHTWFGDRRFATSAKASPLFTRWLAVWILLVGPVILLVALNVSKISAIQAAPGAAKGFLLLQMAHSFALLIIPAVFGVPAMIWYRIATFRYIASHTTLGDITFHSQASGGKVLSHIFWSTLATVGVFIVMGIVIFAVGAASGLVGGHGMAWWVVPVIILAYFGFFLGAQLIHYCWLRAPIIRHLAETMEVRNAAAFAGIAQSTLASSKYGEGVADSFDLGFL